jgi:hypothetical protein
MQLSNDLRQFKQAFKLNPSNVLTLTNPKVLKSESIAPTAVLHLLPTKAACPAAGTCALVCLNTAGNPAYLKGKLACRARRDKAFRTSPNLFLRLLTIEVLRFYSKNSTNELLGLRLNGTSDYHWENIAVNITETDSRYILKTFNINLNSGRYDSILLAILNAFDYNKEARVGDTLHAYDYTKRTDRDFQVCHNMGYHLTLSHGSKFNTLQAALENKLNYAAAFDIGRNKPLPETVTIDGVIFPVLDGDKTDWRIGDREGQTHIVGLRFKRVPNMTEELKKSFCIA